MKKAIACLLILVMIFGNGTVLAQSAADEAEISVDRRVVPAYFGSMEGETEFPVCLLNGVEDIPWVTAEDFRDLLTIFATEYLSDEGYDLKLETKPDEQVVTLTRENGAIMEINFVTDQVAFSDYDLFLHDSSDSSQLDVLSMSGFNEAGEPVLFSRLTEGSFERAGAVIFLNLQDYDINLPFADGTGYIPLQFVSDFILSPQYLMSAFYNGKALFFASHEEFGEMDELTPLGEYYYSAQPAQRSKALAEFGYNELCLALDSLYGLKEIHDIGSFDTLFWEIGYEEDLKSTESLTADDALVGFINYYLDDLHSGFLGYSWMNVPEENGGGYGPANLRYDTHLDEYTKVRTQYLGESPAGYLEVGNTAYITFDEFVCDDWNSYYDELTYDEIPEDTVGLIIAASEMISRDDSPVENVVFDLSCNGGGDVEAALYIMGWVLGDASLCIKNTFTGAMSNLLYRVDVNLDRYFDEEDVLADKDVYCLISPLSFSCGNLLPATFKNSQRVTLIGRTSGGGSCTIMPMSTAWGSSIQISGPTRNSFFKNGSCYDIDQGIEPDIYLSHLSTYYDRDKLTDLINNLD